MRLRSGHTASLHVALPRAAPRATAASLTRADRAGALRGAGSHTVLVLLEHGASVYVIDNLSNSFLRVLDHMKKLAGDKAERMKFTEVRRTGPFRGVCAVGGRVRSAHNTGWEELGARQAVAGCTISLYKGSLFPVTPAARPPPCSLGGLRKALCPQHPTSPHHITPCSATSTTRLDLRRSSQRRSEPQGVGGAWMGTQHGCGLRGFFGEGGGGQAARGRQQEGRALGLVGR